MRMNDLASRIRLGEDGGLEFKEVHFKGQKVVGPALKLPGDCFMPVRSPPSKRAVDKSNAPTLNSSV